MFILGIETSCDETAVSVLEATDADVRAQVLSEEISSQTALHAQYGGVVPELASREHLHNLPLVMDQALSTAGKKISQIDLIAVTRGPGLLGCLLMGMHFARGLSLSLAKPLVDVNHIEAHVLSPWFDNPQLTFPYLGLVVSGGHTELHIVRGVGQYELLSRTIDDAAGEAFDKSAALLGIEYPGGPKLAALADEFAKAGGKLEHKLPVVMQDDVRFSFSGLKTAIALLVKRVKLKQTELAPEQIASLAFAIQEAITEAIVAKIKAAQLKTGIKMLGISGGVSANKRLRSRLAEIPAIQLFAPSSLHCMDNASMIASLGWERYRRGKTLDMRASVLSRWPIEEV
jgi:N6-L-threonylcarbamoyladenine synthase